MANADQPRVPEKHNIKSMLYIVVVDISSLPSNNKLGDLTMTTAPSTTPLAAIKVADEVWIAIAMLHRKRPDRPDFSIAEIMEFGKTAEELRRLGPLRKGFYVHIVQHCVANRPPNPGRYRMLVETAPGRRRLFRPGDSYDPRREGGKASPKPEDLPENWFRGLLAWYRAWCAEATERAVEDDPLLALYGSGKDLWADEPADEYVRRLREGWE
jgi:hypothetical protein